MHRILFMLSLTIAPFFLIAQNQPEDNPTSLTDTKTFSQTSLLNNFDTLSLSGKIFATSPDTLKSLFVRKNPPYLFNANLNHQERSLGNKIGRGTLYVVGYNTTILTYLIFSPTWLSRWDNTSSNFKMKEFFNQYKSSYTKPPVFDEDLFVTNYLGHPYQGGFYYNSLRSQGATMWQSALFSLGQSLIWEYGWEAGFEQPSIQDLIVTPVVGSLYGELTHCATIAMSKHGFRWYEIAAVCVFNPAYAINNGFRFNKEVKRRK